MNVWTHHGIDSCSGAAALDGGSTSTPAAWPVIRILWSGGHLSVMVFFTISGYVLTKRLISLLHEGRQADFTASLHSAVCRRPLRLLLPAIWSTLIILTIWHASGLPAPRKANLFLELVAWAKETAKFVYFYNLDFYSYNHHTWSIQYELRGSMSLFAWLFVLSQTRNKARLLLTLAMIWYLVFGVPQAMLATFFAGMTMAELDLISSGSTGMRLPWDRLAQALGRHSVVRALILHLALLSALYLGGQPSGDGEAATKEVVLGECQGWETLSQLIPDVYSDVGGSHRNFWLFWASWLLLFACKEIGWLRRCLEGGFSQYLGRNSFALYLLHGNMLGLFSERLFYLAAVKEPMDESAQALFGHLSRKWYDASWFPFSDSGPYGLEPNYLFCVAVSVVAFLYVAEIGTKVLDQPSVVLSRWVYLRFLKAK
ncbi:unnamed protein product [Discula destructiva]